MSIETIGVVGAGQMGSGIAHVAAQAGYRVILTDISESALEKGLSSIRNSGLSSLQRKLNKGRISQQDFDVSYLESAVTRARGLPNPKLPMQSFSWQVTIRSLSLKG